MPGEKAPDAANTRRHLLGLPPDQLRSLPSLAAQPAFRTAQILDWIYAKDADSFERMDNLPKALRVALTEELVIATGEIVRISGATDETQKLLIRWPDGGSVETLRIPEVDRDTACVSSQVGCPVGCKFCASGIDGVLRNLTAGEIVEQAMMIRRLVREARKDPKARLTNIVFMGMGEPLANYENVIHAIRILNSPEAFGLGARRITVSTVGLPKQIRRLAEEELQLNLALSLHAPDDALRAQLIPWGKVPIAELLDACRYYFAKTGREITLEYILLDGVNMSDAHARQLANLARQLRCNVNLLRYNPVPGLEFRRPSAEAAVEFQELLRRAGVNAHMRRSRGRDIDAACGQLRRSGENAAAPAQPKA